MRSALDAAAEIRARGGRRRSWTGCASVLCVLAVLVLPLCGSLDAEDARGASADFSDDRHPSHSAGRAELAGKVARLRRSVSHAAGRKAAAAAEANASTSFAGAHSSTGLPRRSEHVPYTVVRLKGRRGLESGALRMLRNLATLVLPYTRAQPSRRWRDNAKGVGGWAETYLCLLNRVQEGLRAERASVEDREHVTDAERKSTIQGCRAELAQIHRAIADASRTSAAMDHSMRVWQRISRGPDHRRGGRGGSTVDDGSKANAIVERLKADRLRNAFATRSLQMRERLSRFQCGMLEWKESHAPIHNAFGGIQHDALRDRSRGPLATPGQLRHSKHLLLVEERLQTLSDDAIALANISRSGFMLNVTLPECSSTVGSRLISTASEEVGLEGQTSWHILATLQRSIQQASQDMFLEVTDLTATCEELQRKSRVDTGALLKGDMDPLETRGALRHLQRIVDQMQVELSAMEKTQSEAREQAHHLTIVMNDTGLPPDQLEHCFTALEALRSQQERARAQVAAKKDDMKAPQKEITRLSALLVNSERKEVTARKEIVVDAFREHRCSSGLRWLRKSAGLIARHSNVLSHLADFPSQSEESVSS